MSSAIGKKSLALAVAGVLGSTAISASAAPYLTVSLLGRVQGSGAPFSSSVAAGAGDVIEYQIQTQLGAEESVNPYAGATNTALSTTISNWVPSNGSTSPTAGLNQARFSLVSGGAATFTTAATPAAGWADAPGNSPGTPAGANLDGVNLIRAAGNFDGIGAAEELELLQIASGTFTVAGAGSVAPSPTGSAFTTGTALATMRWRNDANTANVNYNPTVLQQTNATTGTAQGGNTIDPIIIYQALNIVPEPATFGLLGLAGMGMLARRRRQA